jgi:hypothetical protein
MTKALPGTDAERSIETFASGMGQRLVAALARVARELPEPTPSVAPERALAVVGMAADALHGFAIGSIAAAVARGCDAWLGEDAPAARARVLRIASRPLDEPEQLNVRFITDPDVRPLVDAFGARLWLHLAHARPHVTAIARAAGHDQRVAMLLGVLAKDDGIAERFAMEARTGWAHVHSAIGRAYMPCPASPLWAEWSRRVRREPAPDPRAIILAIA